MNVKLIKKLCMMDRKGVKDILLRFLRHKGYKDIVYTDMYIMAEGTLPVCLLAHMDTVFTFPPSEIFYDKDSRVMWSPDGLGSDDRAGIYAIIDLIEKGYRPSIIFTDLEEEGAIGADALVKQFKECPFKTCKAIIEIDRKGYKEAVFYQCNNRQFCKLIQSYGFTIETGTFTDISVIAPAWGIAAVNLSAGYYNEHSLLEMLRVEELEETINSIEKMLKDCKHWKYYKYIAKKEYRGWNSYVCISCGKAIKNGSIHRVGDLPGGEGAYFCETCYNNYLSSFLDK